MMDKIDLKALIEADRSEHDTKVWQGTLIQYLEWVREHPEIPELAHRRLYGAVMTHGRVPLKDVADPQVQRLFKDSSLFRYNAFADEFFGMEEPINQLMDYLHGASQRAEESRQVLFFLGPVGSGKSTLAEKLESLLEQSGPFYAIEGCPMHEEPLHLIPSHLRSRFSQVLGVHIEGELCPVCHFRLENEFHGEWEQMPVTTVQFSKVRRVGIAKVPPVDANNQDTALLIGSEDISKLDKYSEDDPRVLSLTGAFNRGNRGISEMIEWFKNEIEFLHTAITATQEKIIPAPGRHGMVYVDTVILAHSNESEWRKFKSDPTNEAILDRMVVVKVPYNLRLSEEVKIYEKMLKNSAFNVHVAPHTLEVAAMFAVLSRLEPTTKCDAVTKMKIYNGESVFEAGKTKRFELRELRQDAKNEGMSGISTRFVQKAIDHALANSPDNMVTPISVRDELTKSVRRADIADEVKERYLGFLNDSIHKEYLKLLETEITKAFVYAYHDQAETLFQNYLDHCEAFCNKVKVKDQVTSEEVEPDLDFLKSIEEQIGIFGTAAPGFRQDVMVYLMSAMRRGGSLSYESYEPLKDAIESKLMSTVKDLARIVTQARSRDADQQKKYHDMIRQMLDMGYNEKSAEQVLTYASIHAWRD